MPYIHVVSKTRELADSFMNDLAFRKHYIVRNCIKIGKFRDATRLYESNRDRLFFVSATPEPTARELPHPAYVNAIDHRVIFSKLFEELGDRENMYDYEFEEVPALPFRYFVWEGGHELKEIF